MSYKFIDRAKFMASSLSNLVDNLAERIHKIKCKNWNDNKICKTCRIKCKNFECCLEHTNVKNLISLKCFFCKRSYQKNLNENLKKLFSNTYTFSNYIINKSYSLLKKGVYPQEYMDDWGKFNETSLLEK